VHHSTTIQQLAEGAVQAVCSCGWRSPVFGADKTTGTMDPLQHATEAADLHEWEMSPRLAMLHAWPDVAATPGKPILASRQYPSGSRRVSPPGRLAAALLPDERLRRNLPGAEWGLRLGQVRARAWPAVRQRLAHCGYEPTAVLATMG